MAKITHCSDFQTSAEERTGRAQAGDQVGDVQGVGLGAKMCSVLCILGGGGEAGRRAASPFLLLALGSAGGEGAKRMGTGQFCFF